MKRAPIVFLQAVILLIGIVVLVILIRFPLMEGRATDLDLFLVTDSVPDAMAHIEHHAIRRFGLTRRKGVPPRRWLGEAALR